MAGNGNDHGTDGDLNASTLSIALARQLRALRIAHPEADLQTKAVRLDDDSVVFHAVISLAEGGASAHGSARGSGEGVVELAESRAIARALTALGFADADLADRPARTPLTIADNGDAPSGPPEPATQSHPAPTTPTPLPARAPAERRPAPQIRTTPPIDINANRDRPGTAPQQDPRPSAVPNVNANANANADDEPGMENYSWTEFWKWARQRGLNTKPDLETFIGQTIDSLNPMDVRALIVAKGGKS